MTNFTPGSTDEMMAATPFVKLNIHNSGIKKMSVKFLLLFSIASSGVFAYRRLTSGVFLFKAVLVIALSLYGDDLRYNSIII